MPRHRFKAGFDYWLTSKWKFGADVVAASDQVFLGDEGNDNKPLAGYADRRHLRTSYNITEHMQIYGLIDNVFDSHYGLFGNYYNLAAANNAASADPATGAGFFDNPRTHHTGRAVRSLRRLEAQVTKFFGQLRPTTDSPRGRLRSPRSRPPRCALRRCGTRRNLAHTSERQSGKIPDPIDNRKRARAQANRLRACYLFWCDLLSVRRHRS